MKIVDKFKKNIEKINSIFRIPADLKATYVESISNIISSVDLNYSSKNSAENSKKLIENIHRNHLINSEKQLSVLRSQAVVLVVSNAESILKEIFRNLLIQNIDHEDLDKLDNSQICFKEIRKRKFKISKEDWGNIILDIIWENDRPNFQNLKKVLELFNGYFKLNIKLSEKLIDLLIIFFQIRHIIVHNGSIVDNKLIAELNKANITHKLEVGIEIVVSDDMYNKAKDSFLKLLSEIEEKITQSQFKYSEIRDLEIDDIPF